MTTRHPRDWVARIAAALPAIAGCSGPAAPSVAPTPSADDRIPATLAVAIDDIGRRLERIGEGREDARRECARIATRLPALAADTDLGREAWERVRAVSRRLEAYGAAPAGDGRGREAVPREAWETLREVAATLAVSESGERGGEVEP